MRLASGVVKHSFRIKREKWPDGPIGDFSVVPRRDVLGHDAEDFVMLPKCDGGIGPVHGTQLTPNDGPVVFGEELPEHDVSARHRQDALLGLGHVSWIDDDDIAGMEFAQHRVISNLERHGIGLAFGDSRDIARRFGFDSLHENRPHGVDTV